MKQKIVITGASKGIGFELAKAFLDNNYKVIGTCRTGKIEGISHQDFSTVKLDLSNPTTFEAAVDEIQNIFGTVDILVNNAGIGPDSDLFLPEIESFRQTFEVNTTGTVFFTEAILKLMHDNGKIVNVSSKMGSIELCNDIDSVAYRMSKTALNMYAKILANRLNGKQIVATIHPGWVRTGLAESNVNAPLSAEESATKIFKFVTNNFENGTFWNVDTDSKIDW